MEDVGRFPRKSIGSPKFPTTRSAISLKGPTFFEYRWYKILEALHKSDGEATLETLIRNLKGMGTNPDKDRVQADLIRLEEQEYIESEMDAQFPSLKTYRLTQTGIEKIRRVLRKA
jgi:DNA-binding PadR family transcriptional regulator